MDLEARQALEAEIRRHWAQGDVDRAATAAIRGYGPEVLGFLAAMHPRDEEAAEVFSAWSESVWRGLPSFAWACSFRTWAYAIARHASWHHAKSERRQNKRRVALSDCPAVAEVEARVRTQTLPFLRTQAKKRIAELRDQLPDEDKALLILRVDRRLAWIDLARVLLAERAAEADDEVLKREAARLRKRFQLVKDRLVALAEREGLTTNGEDT